MVVINEWWLMVVIINQKDELKTTMNKSKLLVDIDRSRSLIV